jgi:hypothetical protein
MHAGLDLDHLGPMRDARRSRLLDVAEEVLAKDELHREEDPVAIVRDELVQVHEVRVEDVREGPELLLESIEVARVEVHERLQGDALLPLAIEHLVDDAHAALPEAAQDLVAGGPLPVCRTSR